MKKQPRPAEYDTQPDLQPLSTLPVIQQGDSDKEVVPPQGVTSPGGSGETEQLDEIMEVFEFHYPCLLPPTSVSGRRAVSWDAAASGAAKAPGVGLRRYRGSCAIPRSMRRAARRVSVKGQTEGGNGAKSGSHSGEGKSIGDRVSGWATEGKVHVVQATQPGVMVKNGLDSERCGPAQEDASHKSFKVDVRPQAAVLQHASPAIQDSTRAPVQVAVHESSPLKPHHEALVQLTNPPGLRDSGVSMGASIPPQAEREWSFCQNGDRDSDSFSRAPTLIEGHGLPSREEFQPVVSSPSASPSPSPVSSATSVDSYTEFCRNMPSASLLDSVPAGQTGGIQQGVGLVQSTDSLGQPWERQEEEDDGYVSESVYDEDEDVGNTSSVLEEYGNRERQALRELWGALDKLLRTEGQDGLGQFDDGSTIGTGTWGG